MPTFKGKVVLDIFRKLLLLGKGKDSSEMASMLEQRTIGNYLIGRTLGSGMSGKVRLGSNIHSGEQVALKLIRKDRLTNRQMEMVDREITAMNEMKHPNTVKLLDHSLDATYTKKNGTQYQVVLLVVELAAEGEIFDYIMHTGPFSEDMARTYAVQFLGALESCHAQGIFHRDLKPENLFLDENYQLKVADFGLSAINATDDGTEELLMTECGTRSYMCPEMVAHQRYYGSKADIWSAGVVLFIMMCGHPPFQMASEGDWWFNACKANRHDRFWAAHLRSNPNIPEGFQRFINSIFVVNPDNRASMEDLKNSEWINGAVLSAAEVKQELESRKGQVAAAKEAEKAQARAEKAARMARRGRGGNDPFAARTYRKIGDLRPPPLPVDILEQDVFFSPETAEDMLDSMNSACTDMGASDVKKKTQQCKLKATFQPSPESGSGPIEINFQVFMVKDEEEDMCVLHFQRRSGDVFEFQKVQKAFLEKIQNVMGGGASQEEQKVEDAPLAEEPISDEVDII
mmetsp:Transcript_13587/g.17907  ORF Transcript_13587/g.17907 Transcript_13587/m.17907 type:complete len:515 (+) Transcript_13587:62-1606(+)